MPGLRTIPPNGGNSLKPLMLHGQSIVVANDISFGLRTKVAACETDIPWPETQAADVKACCGVDANDSVDTPVLSHSILPFQQVG